MSTSLGRSAARTMSIERARLALSRRLALLEQEHELLEQAGHLGRGAALDGDLVAAHVDVGVREGGLDGTKVSSSVTEQPGHQVVPGTITLTWVSLTFVGESSRGRHEAHRSGGRRRLVTRRHSFAIGAAAHRGDRLGVEVLQAAGLDAAAFDELVDLGELRGG